MKWKVSSDDYVLTITEDINQASVFHIEETEEPFVLDGKVRLDKIYRKKKVLLIKVSDTQIQ